MYLYSPILSHCISSCLSYSTICICFCWFLNKSSSKKEKKRSKMTLLKDPLRSRMSNKTLEVLIGITINGPEFHTPECDTLINVCVQIWLSKKKSHELPVPKSSEVLHSSQVNNHESVMVSYRGMCTHKQKLYQCMKKSKQLWLSWAFKMQIIILCQSLSVSDES